MAICSVIVRTSLSTGGKVLARTVGLNARQCSGTTLRTAAFEPVLLSFCCSLSIKYL